MAKAKKVYTNAILGPFVFAHAHLSSPDTQGQYADNKYKVDGVAAPGSDVMKAAEAKILEAIKACGLKPKGLNTPLKKQTEKVDGKKTETGQLFIRAKSNRAPVIVDARGEPIPAKALKSMKIGAGSEGRIEGYFTDYETTERVRNADGEVEVITIKGISFTLTGIQLLKYVKAQSQGGFGAYGDGGGFVYDGADEDDDDDASDNSSGGLDIGDDDDDADEGDEGGLDI